MLLIEFDTPAKAFKDLYEHSLFSGNNEVMPHDERDFLVCEFNRDADSYRLLLGGGGC